MEQISPSDLKTILHSKRANIYYLEHCRVLVKGGRVEYVTDQGKRQCYWNIPIANTTTVLLGTGTSITQAAVREMAKAGVIVGFCGGGGTPLFSAMEMDVEVAWLSPQSEYRPTEYLQAWVRIWLDEPARLSAAKAFQRARLARIGQSWTQRRTREQGFPVPDEVLAGLLENARQGVERAKDNVELLTEEARLTKELFKIAARAVAYGEFTRAKRGTGGCCQSLSRPWQLSGVRAGSHRDVGARASARPCGVAREDPPRRPRIRRCGSGQGCCDSSAGIRVRHARRRGARLSSSLP